MSDRTVTNQGDHNPEPGRDRRRLPRMKTIRHHAYDDPSVLRYEAVA